MMTGSLFPGYAAIFNKTDYPVSVTSFFRNLRPDFFPETVDTLRTALSLSLPDGHTISRNSLRRTVHHMIRCIILQSLRLPSI